MWMLGSEAKSVSCVSGVQRLYNTHRLSGATQSLIICMSWRCCVQFQKQHSFQVPTRKSWDLFVYMFVLLVWAWNLVPLWAFCENMNFDVVSIFIFRNERCTHQIVTLSCLYFLVCRSFGAIARHGASRERCQATSPGVGNLFMLEGRINLTVIK
jgi:hypothetical protein